MIFALLINMYWIISNNEFHSTINNYVLCIEGPEGSCCGGLFLKLQKKCISHKVNMAQRYSRVFESNPKGHGLHHSIFCFLFISSSVIKLFYTAWDNLVLHHHKYWKNFPSSLHSKHTCVMKRAKKFSEPTFLILFDGQMSLIKCVQDMFYNFTSFREITFQGKTVENWQ